MRVVRNFWATSAGKEKPVNARNTAPPPSLFCSAEMQDTEGRRNEKDKQDFYSLSFLSLSAGTALDMAGEADVDGGEAGWSLSMFARRLKVLECDVFSRVGGVPVRDEAPESSPGRPR